jgi:hypothetical protein
VSVAALVLPALVPAIADGLRALFNKIAGAAGAAPKNVAESIELMRAQTERVHAIAALDNPGGKVSQWVADLRGSYRYIATGSIVLAVIPAVLIAPEAAGTLVLLELAGACMSFIIGERMYLQIKR